VQITASKIKIDYLLDMEPPESVMPAGFSSWDKLFVIPLSGSPCRLRNKKEQAPWQIIKAP